MDKLIDLFFHLVTQAPAWLQAIALALAALVALVATLRFVKEAEQGLKLRFGQVVRNRHGEPRIIHPGFTLVIPKVEQLVRRHVRQQTLKLHNQEILLKDNSIFIVSAIVFFRVENIYKALFEVDNLDVAVENFCMRVLRTTLQGLDGVDSIKDIAHVSKLLEDAARERFGDWGIELVEFGLVNCAPSRETASFITAAPAVRARVEALKAQSVTNPMMAAALLGAPAVAALSDAGPVPVPRDSTVTAPNEEIA